MTCTDFRNLNQSTAMFLSLTADQRLTSKGHFDVCESCRRWLINLPQDEGRDHVADGATVERLARIDAASIKGKK